MRRRRAGNKRGETERERERTGASLKTHIQQGAGEETEGEERRGGRAVTVKEREDRVDMMFDYLG